MRRLLLVFTAMALMVAMVVVMTVPAFADPGNGNGASVAPHSCFPGNGTDCIHLTETPSGNVNLEDHFKTNPGNGNGAIVTPRSCSPSTLNGSGTACNHDTETPSGNLNVDTHFKPNS
jgi:hypothetical protein